MMHEWPSIPYPEWSATCDTLHAHTQVLGKLAAALAPPEPQLQHCALRLTARGWETAPLPAPDGSGVVVAALDLRVHEAVLEHNDGRLLRVPLTPNRSVGQVTRDVLGGISGLAGPVQVNMRPQEVPWSIPLDADDEHHTYDPAHVERYHAAAVRAALVLAAVRAPYRGRSSPVNAWWGTFDLAVSLYSGRPATPPSADFIMRNSGSAQQIEVGWWPGDPRYPRAAFFAFANPAPEGFGEAILAPDQAGWNADLGEYVFDWDDVITAPDPYEAALRFGRLAVDHACAVCDWDSMLADSARGTLPALD